MFTDGHLYKQFKGQAAGVKVILSGEDAAVLQEFNGSSQGSHSGVNRTYDAIKLCYWWPSMSDCVRNYVS